MFLCQNEKCSHSFAGMPRFSKEHDNYTVVCPECGAVHVAIEKSYQPSGAVDYKYKILPPKK